MDHPHEPMEVINLWQKWAKNHRVVAEMDEPLATKNSRENLHDTSNAHAEIKDWRTFFKELTSDSEVEKTSEQKATEYFADTIAEFLPELGGEKLYECFMNAAKQGFEHAQKEYDNNKDLIDCFQKKKK